MKPGAQPRFSRTAKPSCFRRFKSKTMTQGIGGRIRSLRAATKQTSSRRPLKP
jgi:hypothetical protein